MLLVCLLSLHLLLCSQQEPFLGAKRVRFTDEQRVRSSCSTIIPFDRCLYEKFYETNSPEQCLTKKSSLYCIQSYCSPDDEPHSIHTTIPFSSCNPVEMKPFGQSKFRDNYFGYAFLRLGVFLYNQSVDVAHKKTLAEQCYTKKSTYWCVKK